jgi:hypothetical protein
MYRTPLYDKNGVCSVLIGLMPLTFVNVNVSSFYLFMVRRSFSLSLKLIINITEWWTCCWCLFSEEIKNILPCRRRCIYLMLLYCDGFRLKIIYPDEKYHKRPINVISLRYIKTQICTIYFINELYTIYIYIVNILYFPWLYDDFFVILYKILELLIRLSYFICRRSKHMSYVYPYNSISRPVKVTYTSTDEARFFCSGCGRMVLGAEVY